MFTPPTAAPGLDARSLDALRNQAARDPKNAARQAAVQFESLFMQMVVKSMRDATPKAEGASPTTENFTSMLDTQLSKQFAGRPGGLAELIEKQLTRHMDNLPPVSADNAAAAQAAQAAQAAAAQAQAASQAQAQATLKPRLGGFSSKNWKTALEIAVWMWLLQLRFFTRTPMDSRTQKRQAS